MSSAIRMMSYSTENKDKHLSGLSANRSFAAEGHPPCEPDVSMESEGFKCSVCENNEFKNLALLLTKEGKSCVLDHPTSNAGYPSVIELVKSDSLPNEICASNEDDDGYSWKNNKGGSTCEEKYAAALSRKGFGDDPSLQPILQSEGYKNLITMITDPKDESIDTEPMRGIDAGVFPTEMGDRHYAIVWPREGTCTEQNKCMLYVHLHSLFESARPSSLFCGSVPKYVTNDQSCYDNLRSVVLIPQLDKNFMRESWNPDGSKFSGQDTHESSFDNYLFPLIENFLDNNKQKIDPNLVSVGGGSSGANGAMWAALKRPDLFRLAIASDPCAYGFLTDPEDKELIENLPPANERKLQQIIMARGDNEKDSMCPPKDTGLDMSVLGPLAEKVPIKMRVYSDLGHGVWGHLMNQWQDLHDVIITGKKSYV